jgi:hypothetical protein
MRRYCNKGMAGRTAICHSGEDAGSLLSEAFLGAFHGGTTERSIFHFFLVCDFSEALLVWYDGNKVHREYSTELV